MRLTPLGLSGHISVKPHSQTRRFALMNQFSRILSGFSLAVTCTCLTAAQEKTPASMPIPKVLQITREFVKPGKAGAVHDKAESAFVQAMTRAKWPTRYLGMTSLSGKSRALFLTWYDSFEAWEKDTKAVEKNSALMSALDRASVADGELLDSLDQGVFVFNEELSLRPRPDLSQMRYLVISARKSLSEVDRAFLDSKQFRDAMGEDGMKKLNDLVALTIESSQHNLFAFNPRMSYVADEWIKADPD